MTKEKNTKADLIVSVTFVFNLKHIFISMEPNKTEIGQWATACKTLLINDGRLQVARQSSPTPSIISQFSCGNKNTRKSNTVSIDQQKITINYVGRPKTVVFIAIIRRWHSGFCLTRWIVLDTVDCVRHFGLCLTVCRAMCTYHDKQLIISRCHKLYLACTDRSMRSHHLMMMNAFDSSSYTST